MVLVKSEMKNYNSIQILQNTTNDILPVQLMLYSITTNDIFIQNENTFLRLIGSKICNGNKTQTHMKLKHKTHKLVNWLVLLKI